MIIAMMSGTFFHNSRMPHLISALLLIIGCLSIKLAKVEAEHTGNWVQPKLNWKWHWQIGKPFVWEKHNKPGVKLYDVDLFDTKESEIRETKKRNKVVACYFEAGTWVKDRPFAGKYARHCTTLFTVFVHIYICA